MPIPTPALFLLRFPEFAELPAGLVSGALDDATLRSPETVWLNHDVRTAAIYYLAAHLLAIRQIQIGQQIGAPAGNPQGTGYDATLYGQERRRLEQGLALTGLYV